jgi:hypothetical protein
MICMPDRVSTGLGFRGRYCPARDFRGASLRSAGKASAGPGCSPSIWQNCRMILRASGEAASNSAIPGCVRKCVMVSV